MTISSAVSEAINKELPNAVAQELKAFIERANKDASRNEFLEDQVKELEKNKKELSVEVQDLRALQLRKSELDEKERGMKVEMAELKVEEAEKRAELAYNLVDRVFKNPVVKKQAFGSTSVWNPQYSGMASVPTNETTTETTE
jgi:uncharacterized protein YydD (DUF2326 family)